MPPEYAAWLRGRAVEAGGLPPPDWSRDAALAVMDRFSIETAILSVSTPGVHLGDDVEARHWARAVNEYASGIVRRRHTGRNAAMSSTETLSGFMEMFSTRAFVMTTRRKDLLHDRFQVSIEATASAMT